MGNGYRVLDERNNATYFVGKEWECIQFLSEKYPDGEEGSEYMKLGINNYVD